MTKPQLIKIEDWITLSPQERENLAALEEMGFTVLFYSEDSEFEIISPEDKQVFMCRWPAWDLNDVFKNFVLWELEDLFTPQHIGVVIGRIKESLSSFIVNNRMETRQALENVEFLPVLKANGINPL